MMKNKWLLSFMALSSISINSVNARVPKAVAEAYLPSILEAVGLSTNNDKNAGAKKDAIIKLIYTDEGQYKMINWVENNVVPKILACFFQKEGPLWSTIETEKLNSMFGTVPGFNIRDPKKNKSFNDIYPDNTDTQHENVPENNSKDSLEIPKEILMAIHKVIYLLVLCDNEEILKTNAHKILNVSQEKMKWFDDIKITDNDTVLDQDYTCRPMPSSYFFAKDSTSQDKLQECIKLPDCVETLLRHLITIACRSSNDGFTLNDTDKACTYNIERWIATNRSAPQSGILSPTSHTEWVKVLKDLKESKNSDNISLSEKDSVPSGINDIIVYFERLYSRICAKIKKEGLSQEIQLTIQKILKEHNSDSDSGVSKNLEFFMNMISLYVTNSNVKTFNVSVYDKADILEKKWLQEMFEWKGLSKILAEATKIIEENNKMQSNLEETLDSIPNEYITKHFKSGLENNYSNIIDMLFRYRIIKISYNSADNKLTYEISKNNVESLIKDKNVLKWLKELFSKEDEKLITNEIKFSSTKKTKQNTKSQDMNLSKLIANFFKSIQVDDVKKMLTIIKLKENMYQRYVSIKEMENDKCIREYIIGLSESQMPDIKGQSYYWRGHAEIIRVIDLPNESTTDTTNNYE